MSFSGKICALILGGTLAFSTTVTAAPTVLIETNMGNVTVELDQQKAPVTVKNFINYVNEGHYQKTIFHRVIPNFMIQGGGFDENMMEKDTKAPIRLESRNGLRNLRGSIAMARTSDPNSATSQFFINVRNNHFLDAANSADGYGYTVFGKVIDGMETVDAISHVRTQSVNYYDDVPIRPVVIKNIRIIKGK